MAAGAGLSGLWKGVQVSFGYTDTCQVCHKEVEAGAEKTAAACKMHFVHQMCASQDDEDETVSLNCKVCKEHYMASACRHQAAACKEYAQSCLRGLSQWWNSHDRIAYIFNAK